MQTGIDYDILIIGGGMVGATLVLALRDTPYRVGVVEAYAFGNERQPSYDDRSIALSYGSKRILEGFGLWQALEKYCQAIKTIHVSDRGYFGAARLHADEEQVEALGYVIENRNIGEVFARQLSNTVSDFICPAQLKRISVNQNYVEIDIDIDGTRVTKRTRLLVAADGARSAVRAQLGIATISKDYDQSAIIANITPQKAHLGVAYERFTRNGPIALLPMLDYQGQARCSLVWTLPSECANTVMDLKDEQFLSRLQDQFGFRLGRLLKMGQRSLYPLHLSTSDRSVERRVLFMGNAKQSLHPVAGQGFNLALRDVAELCRLISAETAIADVGNATILNGYAENRQQDRDRVIRFTDGLITVFTNSIKPLGVIRGLGLMALDIMPYVRHRFARFSMGLSA